MVNEDRFPESRGLHAFIFNISSLEFYLAAMTEVRDKYVSHTTTEYAQMITSYVNINHDRILQPTVFVHNRFR